MFDPLRRRPNANWMRHDALDVTTILHPLAMMLVAHPVTFAGESTLARVMAHARRGDAATKELAGKVLAPSGEGVADEKHVRELARQLLRLTQLTRAQPASVQLDRVMLAGGQDFMPGLGQVIGGGDADNPGTQYDDPHALSAVSRRSDASTRRCTSWGSDRTLSSR